MKAWFSQDGGWYGQGGFWREAAPLGLRDEQEESISGWGPEKAETGGVCCDLENGEGLNVSKLRVCVGSHCLERPPSRCTESWRGHLEARKAAKY